MLTDKSIILNNNEQYKHMIIDYLRLTDGVGNYTPESVIFYLYKNGNFVKIVDYVKDYYMNVINCLFDVCDDILSEQQTYNSFIKDMCPNFKSYTLIKDFGDKYNIESQFVGDKEKMSNFNYDSSYEIINNSYFNNYDSIKSICLDLKLRKMHFINLVISACNRIKINYKDSCDWHLINGIDTVTNEVLDAKGIYEYYLNLIQFSKIFVPYIKDCIICKLYKIYVICEANAISSLESNESSVQYDTNDSFLSSDEIDGHALINGNAYAGDQLNDSNIELGRSDMYKLISEINKTYTHKPKWQIDTTYIVQYPQKAINEATFLLQEAETNATSTVQNNTSTNRTGTEKVLDALNTSKSGLSKGYDAIIKKVQELVDKFVKITGDLIRRNSPTLKKAEGYSGKGNDVSGVNMPPLESLNKVIDYVKVTFPKYITGWENELDNVIIPSKNEDVDKARIKYKYDLSTDNKKLVPVGQNGTGYFELCKKICLLREPMCSNIEQERTYLNNFISMHKNDKNSQQTQKTNQPKQTKTTTTTTKVFTSNDVSKNESVDYIRSIAMNDSDLINILLECSDEEILNFYNTFLNEDVATTKNVEKEQSSDVDDYIRKYVAYLTRKMTIFDSTYDLCIKFLAKYMK